MSDLKMMDYRAELDIRDEKLGRKIRDAQMEKIPFMLVIGDKEVESGTVSVRDRSEGDLGAMSIDSLVEVFGKQKNPLKDSCGK